MWPQERQAAHQTIHINLMQWNFSHMEGVYPLLVQWSWKYVQKAILSILNILAILSLLTRSGPPPLHIGYSKSYLQ